MSQSIVFNCEQTSITRARDRTFDTKDEKRYITSLGSHIHPTRRRLLPTSREKLLEAYLVAAASRERWGNIDRATVVSHATTALRRLRQRKLAATKAIA